MNNKIVVVGGGAAGMIAAIAAKRNGGNVVLLERNDRLGKKLLATGNGRCNYTNRNLNIKNYHGANPKFAYSVLSQFNVDTTMEFFESLGITPAVEDNGKVFPLSFQSSSMLDILKYEIKNQGIELITDAYVSSIKKNEDFTIELENGQKIYADKVILASGGKALPTSGSDGNGYKLCELLGHETVAIFPGLVQLQLEGKVFKPLSGTKFLGRAGIYVEDKLIVEDTGDILFTDYGISGPPILQLSRKALEYLKENKEVEIRLSIIHTKNMEELYEYLLYRFNLMPTKNIEEALIGLINKKLILPVLKEANIDKNKNAANLSNEEIRKLAKTLLSWSFKVTGSQPWEYAQVTAGGINTKDINNKTMESKIHRGLYIVGELVDIDGDCGGYNLQWAWSSGYIAGENAALN